MVIRSVLLASVLLLSSACVPVALTAGAATGIAASKEGGISSELSDARIGAEINDAWFQYDFDTFRKLNLTVEQGNVLITGVVQNPEDRVEAVRLAWDIDGVKQVINEVQIAESDGVTGYLRDTWIGTQLRARLTANRRISALNYTIDVVKGTVYLMGIARSQTELNEVVDIARNLQYVQNVVSYVRVDVPQTPVIQDTAQTPTQTAPIPANQAVGNNSVIYNSGTQQNIPVTSQHSVIGAQQPIVEDPGF